MLRSRRILKNWHSEQSKKNSNDVEAFDRFRAFFTLWKNTSAAPGASMPAKKKYSIAGKKISVPAGKSFFYSQEKSESRPAIFCFKASDI